MTHVSRPPSFFSSPPKTTYPFSTSSFPRVIPQPLVTASPLDSNGGEMAPRSSDPYIIFKIVSGCPSNPPNLHKSLNYIPSHRLGIFMCRLLNEENLWGPRDQMRRLIGIPEDCARLGLHGLGFLRRLFWTTSDFGAFFGLLGRGGCVPLLIDVHGWGWFSGSRWCRSEGRRPVRRPAVFEPFDRVTTARWILVQHGRGLGAGRWW